jgi:hypothetical protein
MPCLLEDDITIREHKVDRNKDQKNMFNPKYFQFEQLMIVSRVWEDNSQKTNNQQSY